MGPHSGHPPVYRLVRTAVLFSRCVTGRCVLHAKRLYIDVSTCICCSCLFGCFPVHVLYLLSELGVGAASYAPCLHRCCCSCCEASRWLGDSLVSWLNCLHGTGSSIGSYTTQQIDTDRILLSSMMTAGGARTLAPALGKRAASPLSPGGKIAPCCCQHKNLDTSGQGPHSTHTTPAAGWHSWASCSLLPPSCCHRLPASVRTSLRTSACQLTSLSTSAGGASTATVGLV